MDIALIVDKLVPGAEYTQSIGADGEPDYEVLKRTWTDARQIPTEQEIIDAEAEVVADQAARDGKPSLDECVEALMALSNDASLIGLKARLAASKTAEEKWASS